ncbi:8983_t:CDS:1, partial [Paraglomus occultum]
EESLKANDTVNGMAQVTVLYNTSSSSGNSVHFINPGFPEAFSKRTKIIGKSMLSIASYKSPYGV